MLPPIVTLSGCPFLECAEDSHNILKRISKPTAHAMATAAPPKIINRARFFNSVCN
jgi:hypothetical protein